MTRIPLWLDCDPGHDDAFAILLASYHPALRLLGISTVFGNASLEKTTQNASSVLTAIGRDHDIPVYIGASHALVRPPIHAPTDIHGESGLDGTSLLPKPRVGADASVPAVDAMYTALRAERPGTAWLVATGSFTNVAALFHKYPDLVSHVKGVSLMGGAVGEGFTPAVMGSAVDGLTRIGNWTHFAEFNVLVDPEAAAWIFSNKELARKTTLVTLDVTHLVLATREIQALLLWGKSGPREGVLRQPGQDAASSSRGMAGTQTAKSTLRMMLVELLLFFAKTYKDVFGMTEGPPLHDPLAVAAILAGAEAGEYEIPFHDLDVRGPPGAKIGERYEVTVVTEGTHEQAHAGLTQTGRTLVKLLPPGEEGVTIPRGLDVRLFWKVLEECVERADEVMAKPL